MDEEKVEDLILSIITLGQAIEILAVCLETLGAQVEQLDARSQVTQSAYVGLLARIEKLES